MNGALDFFVRRSGRIEIDAGEAVDLKIDETRRDPKSSAWLGSSTGSTCAISHPGRLPPERLRPNERHILSVSSRSESVPLHFIER